LKEGRLDTRGKRNGEEAVPDLSVHCCSNTGRGRSLGLEDSSVALFPDMVDGGLKEKLDYSIRLHRISGSGSRDPNPRGC